MHEQNKMLVEFCRSRLDRFIDTSNLTDAEVMELTRNGKYSLFTSTEVKTMQHNYLSNMSKKIKRQNPELHSAMITLLNIAKENTKPKGWEDNVYYF